MNFGIVRSDLGEILRQLCQQKGVELVEGKAETDHVHMLLSVPPKYSIAMMIGYLKGKSEIRVHRESLKTRGTSCSGKRFGDADIVLALWGWMN